MWVARGLEDSREGRSGCHGQEKVGGRCLAEGLSTWTQAFAVTFLWLSSSLSKGLGKKALHLASLDKSSGTWAQVPPTSRHAALVCREFLLPPSGTPHRHPASARRGEIAPQ